MTTLWTLNYLFVFEWLALAFAARLALAFALDIAFEAALCAAFTALLAAFIAVFI